MSKKTENVGFICESCGFNVLPIKRGSYRNHCPNCLYSKHVDNNPGDRENECRGLMKPIAIKKSSKKGFQLIHKCLLCNEVKVNKIVENDKQRDNFELVLELMRRS